jgi:hypothetical protein
MFIVGDAVDVRFAATEPWRDGAVAVVEESRYGVDLTTPIPANTWINSTRKYGGNPDVTRVWVTKNCGAPDGALHKLSATLCHVRAHGA